ncbi:zinc-binding dehydrogenase [Paenibacillus sp. TAF58]
MLKIGFRQDPCLWVGSLLFILSEILGHSRLIKTISSLFYIGIMMVGGAETLNQSITALRVGGRISIVGLLSGGSVEGFHVVPAILRRARLQAINVGSREMFESMNRAVSNHKLRPAIDRVFPFEQAIDAFKYFENGSYFGKICITL